MAAVEPVPGAPAAVVTTAGERLLVVADYHAGIEAVLRSEGVELDSGAPRRRERLLGLVAETGADRLVVLGDLTHAVGDPWGAEREELAALFDALGAPTLLVKGNHDGEIEPVIEDLAVDVTVAPAAGTRVGAVGFAHGHTWPSPEVLAAETVCTAHEHPVVRLEDEVGGGRRERVWLRGRLAPAPFREHHGEGTEVGEELVVFPAFNDTSGGTWVNVAGQDFLSPFLPEGLADGQAYLLDGTRLGRYDRV
ncbi:metallophosphoesterase [Salinirussus salinus]|uniref:metallophosphoesterase n=1 Tax=Salinirussus salinus TaxID=1198300 RepID=UPI00135BA0C1|nr:metallophosphoesterase [Salinirussus salinus]